MNCEPHEMVKGTALAVWGVYGRWVPHTRAIHDAAHAYASRTFRVSVPTYPYYTVRATP